MTAKFERLAIAVLFALLLLSGQRTNDLRVQLEDERVFVEALAEEASRVLEGL